MTRKKATSRVASETEPISGSSKSVPDRIPSLRVRKPLVFWVVVLGTFSMVLTVVATFVSALAQQ